MKWIICSLALLGATTINAQTISVSPYSALGVGEQLYNNNSEINGMGGITTVPTNPYGQSANFSNPAANQDLRMTNFNFSGRGDSNSFKTETESKTAGSFKLSNISLAFPVSKKSALGIGFQPYTGLGYNISNGKKTTQGLSQQSIMTGDGGINSLHAFYNYNVNNNLSFGLRANYLFGQLKTNELVTVEGASLIADYDTKANYKGVQFTLGSMYKLKLENKKNLNIGAYYTIGTKLNTDLKELTSTYSAFYPSDKSLDTVYYNRSTKLKTQLPSIIALGASYSKDNSWSIGGELRYNTWSNFSKPSLGGLSTVQANTKYKDNLYVGVGGYWVPNFNSYRSYFSRVVYRGGLYYESAPYSIYGHDIERYGVTIGAGLPIGKQNDASMINVSLEYGQKGTDKYQLIKEDYVGFKIGFDINDIWFRKRVID
jgi:long-subunit fatty acid transport protein